MINYVNFFKFKKIHKLLIILENNGYDEISDI